jgi:serine/threonine protein kinase
MGDVYRARDLRLGRMVAIKFVSPHLYGKPEAEARLDREARLASSLNHPAIVSVFDVGHHDAQPYVVMELIEGRTLAARIGAGRLPIREAVEIAMQVADGLAAAHDAGVVHRDLKPQNIMLTAEGRPKVVDFGLSKVAASPESGNSETIQGDTLTDRYAVLGPGDMAPNRCCPPVDGVRLPALA